MYAIPTHIFHRTALTSEIEITTIMAQSDIFDISEIFPCPIKSREFTIGTILFRNIISGIIALKAQIQLRVESFAYLNRHVVIILSDCVVGFMTSIFKRGFLFSINQSK